MNLFLAPFPHNQLRAKIHTAKNRKSYPTALRPLSSQTANFTRSSSSTFNPIAPSYYLPFFCYVVVVRQITCFSDAFRGSLQFLSGAQRFYGAFRGPCQHGYFCAVLYSILERCSPVERRFKSPCVTGPIKKKPLDLAFGIKRMTGKGWDKSGNWLIGATKFFR